MYSNFKRKRNRASNFNYKGAYSYFLTIRTADKHKYFEEGLVVADIIECLRREADAFHFKVYAYCFMPDHLHLLLVGDYESELIRFMKMFKQKTSYNYKQKHGNVLWQKSYYDHIIRQKNKVNEMTAYIFYNPVKSGLVNDPKLYPYSGSLVFDYEAFCDNLDLLANIDPSTLLK
ncbi:MAG: transposase [bacterium]